MTKTEQVEIRQLRNEITDIKNDIADIKESLSLMIPKKWGTTTVKVFRWVIATVIAIWGVIALYHHTSIK